MLLRCFFLCTIIAYLVKFESSITVEPRYSGERVAASIALIRPDAQAYLFPNFCPIGDAVSAPDVDSFDRDRYGYVFSLASFERYVRSVLASNITSYISARCAVSLPQKRPARQSPDEDPPFIG